MKMNLKEKIITIDMAVSIFAILLIGVFLGQALDLTKTGLPVISAFLIFAILAFIIVLAYLMFNYTIRRAYGKYILEPECKCEHKEHLATLYRWANHECEMSPRNELTVRKELFCLLAREIKRFLPGEK
jgi:hypothetical protein